MTLSLLKTITIALAMTASVNAVEQDKQLHFAVSYAIGAVSQHYADDWRKSMLFCSAIGAAKEAYDYHIYGVFDKHDLAYDLAGCASGIATYALFNVPIELTPQNDGASLNYRGTF